VTAQNLLYVSYAWFHMMYGSTCCATARLPCTSGSAQQIQTCFKVKSRDSERHWASKARTLHHRSPATLGQQLLAYPSAIDSSISCCRHTGVTCIMMQISSTHRSSCFPQAQGTLTPAAALAGSCSGSIRSLLCACMRCKVPMLQPGRSDPTELPPRNWHLHGHVEGYKTQQV
jgi:hypothetical protein